jgi:predicted ArsR family transcriptional regulator
VVEAAYVMTEGPGRPPNTTDEDILEVFVRSSDPILTATEIAAELDIGRRGLLARLEELEDEGFLISKSVGSRSVVWWYPGHTETRPVDADR